MSDMTTDQLRRTMRAIVEIAPETPDALELEPTPTRRPRRGSSVLVAAAAFLTVLLVGGSSVLLFAGPPGSDAASGTTAASGDESPPVTTADSDLVTDSEAAISWRDQVNQALAEAGLELEVTRSYETQTSITEGGSVTAATDDNQGRLVLVVDLQAWTDGEYRPDTEWQAEVAGATEPGTAIPEGTLFVFDERQTTATRIQTIILVSEDGLLTVKAEETPSVPLIDVDTLESVTRSLGGEIGELTQSEAAAPESGGEPGSPLVGLDESFLGDIRADGSVNRHEIESAYEAFFGCLAANGGSGAFAFNLDYGPALSYDVGFEGVSDSEVVDKIVDACRASYLGLNQAYGLAGEGVGTREGVVFWGFSAGTGGRPCRLVGVFRVKDGWAWGRWVWEPRPMCRRPL